MGNITLEVPHTLSKDEAKLRAEKLAAHWGRKYGMAISWSGDTAKVLGKVMGISIDATLDVLEGRVVMVAPDPGMLFRGKATKYLKEKFAEFLDPKKSLRDFDAA